MLLFILCGWYGSWCDYVVLCTFDVAVMFLCCVSIDFMLIGVCGFVFFFFFFFSQKTAYEWRISDWSSDVCSSDRQAGVRRNHRHPPHGCRRIRHPAHAGARIGNCSGTVLRYAPDGYSALFLPEPRMPELSNLLAFALLALGMVLTPGPNMVYLISRSISQGPRAGLVSLGGVAVGFVFYVLCAALGITALLMSVPFAYDALRLGGRSEEHTSELQS